jgi:L-malate glycosyltransferase
VKPVVLVIENSVDVTGALNSVLRTAEGLRHEYEFHFIFPSKSAGPGWVSVQGFQVHQMPMREIRKDIFSLLLYLPVLLANVIRLRRLIRKIRPALIVSNDFYNLLPAVYRFLGGGLPYVCYVRFLPHRFPRLLVAWWCAWHRRFAASVVAVSGAVKDQLPGSMNPILIYDELPPDHVDFTIPEMPVILYPANYIEGKGQEHALICFEQVHRKYPHWQLRFVGSDMGLTKNQLFKQRLMKQSERLGLAGSVQWGAVSNNLKNDYLGCSFMLNFSESESFSLTCQEAQFYGRPVVATKSGGPQEIIENGKTGFLVARNDLDAMTIAVEQLISDRVKRETFAAAAYDHVRQRFDLSKTRHVLLNMYANILNLK